MIAYIHQYTWGHKHMHIHVEHMNRKYTTATTTQAHAQSHTPKHYNITRTPQTVQYQKCHHSSALVCYCYCAERALLINDDDACCCCCCCCCCSLVMSRLFKPICLAPQLNIRDSSTSTFLSAARNCCSSS
jgi:hypothetical protein